MNILFWMSFALLWIIVAVQGFALLEVLRQIGYIRKQLGSRQGALIMKGVVKAGDSLPDLVGYSAIGRRSVIWKEYLNPVFSVVVLLSTHCTVCRTLANDLTRFAAEVKDEVAIIVILEGRSNEVQTFINETQLDRSMVIIDENKINAERFGVMWNPAAITIRNGRLGEAAIVNDIDQLDALVASKEAEYVNI